MAVGFLSAVVMTGCASESEKAAAPTDSSQSAPVVAPPSTAPIAPPAATTPERPLDYEALAKAGGTSSEIGEGYLLIGDPIDKGGNDASDKEIQAAVPACKGVDLLMPALLPFTETKTIRAWLYLNTNAAQQNYNGHIVIVMGSEEAAKALMARTRASTAFAECRAGWIAEVGSRNATSSGVWAGKVVRYTAAKVHAGEPIDGLGDDQIVTSWEQSLVADGNVIPTTTFTGYTARFGSAIMMYDDGPSETAKQVAPILAAKLRALMSSEPPDPSVTITPGS